jgi:hypothetical protein
MVGHGVSSPKHSVAMQERAEALDGTHRSLTTTLVFGRSQHNGNIFAGVLACQKNTLLRCMLRHLENLPQ